MSAPEAVRFKTRAIVLSVLLAVCVLSLLGYWHWELSYYGKVVAESECPDGYGLVRVRAMPTEPLLALLFVSGGGFRYRCEWYSKEDIRLYSAKSYGTQSYEARSIQVIWISKDYATVVFNGGERKFRCNHGDWEY
jgi:hypothetical protein